jgi:ribosomal protein S26
MTFKPRLHSIISGEELGNEEYHSQSKWWSSSQVKEALSDIRTFYKTFISKELSKDFGRQTQIAMDIGTYFHTAILEPEKVIKECSVWEGMRKGKAYEEFMVKNKGKTVITATDFEKAQALISAVKKDPESMKLLNKGEAEVSAFTKLQGLNVRVRADWIDLDRGFIMDLKSCGGSVYDEFEIAKKIENLHYDLSAAMYLEAFNRVLKKQKKPLLHSFYWVFASKDTACAQVYKASPRMLALGASKLNRALNTIKDNESKGWAFESSVIELDPSPWAEGQWLKNDQVINNEEDEEDFSDLL